MSLHSNRPPTSDVEGQSPDQTKDRDSSKTRENMGPQDLALGYHRRGWAVIDVPWGAKNPGRKGWQHERHDDASIAESFGKRQHNIGVLLGSASNNLIDCDQDHPLWAELAPSFLPPTNSRFGRAGKPGGHRLYTADELPPSRAFADPIPMAEGGMGTIGELRASPTLLTIMPGSLHRDSGEMVTWAEDGEPTNIHGDELMRVYAEGCAWVLLRHHWPGEHARHIPALALAGGLLRAGWEDDRVEALLRFIWPSADPNQIQNVIRTTTEKLASGDKAVTGFTALQEHVNPAIVRKFREWAGIKGGSDRPPLTDFGNAERFAAMYGKDVRYCKAWRKWLVWDGMRWQTDDTDTVVEWGKLAIRAIPEEIRDEPDGDVRKNTLKWAVSSEHGKRLETMLRLAQSIDGIAIRPDDLDRHPWLLNVSNGTIDLQKLELRAARREDLITKVAPVAYLPDATAPSWERYIRSATSLPATTGPVEQPELAAFLQRFVGYMLTGDTSEKALPIAYGPGDTGKTTFTEILLDLFGNDYGITTAESTIAASKNDSVPNDVAALRGARLVVVSETSQGMRLNEGRIKAMTGRNRMSARFFYQEWFTFLPEFKLLIETNHKPTVIGTDTAIWNRIKPIPFLNVMSEGEKDPDLPDKLRAELPGILNWALAGCAAWRHGGLQVPDTVKAANAEYRDESDRLADFLSECCITDTEKSTRSGEVYTAYNTFMKERGHHPLGDQGFSAAMKERGFIKKEKKGIGHWLRLELKNAYVGANLFTTGPTGL